MDNIDYVFETSESSESEWELSESESEVEDEEEETIADNLIGEEWEVSTAPVDIPFRARPGVKVPVGTDPKPINIVS